MKNPKLYKGIEYVQLDELPEEQQLQIRESFNEGLFVKILINGKLHEDCILYKDYSYWFHSAYRINHHTSQEKSITINIADDSEHVHNQKI